MNSPITLATALMTDSPIVHISDVIAPDNSLVAEFHAHLDDRIIYITWHGHLNSDKVVQVASEGLRLRKAGGSTPFVINDKSRATGDWADAIQWLEYEWLPQTVAGGLRALAYVVSEDMSTYMAGFDFYQRVRKVLPLKLFSKASDAREWLLSQDEEAQTGVGGLSTDSGVLSRSILELVS